MGGQSGCCPLPSEDVVCTMEIAPVLCANGCEYSNSCLAGAAGQDLESCEGADKMSIMSIGEINMVGQVESKEHGDEEGKDDEESLGSEDGEPLIVSETPGDGEELGDIDVEYEGDDEGKLLGEDEELGKGDDELAGLSDVTNDEDSPAATIGKISTFGAFIFIISVFELIFY